MNDAIICPNCKESIPLSQALSHQLKENYQKELKEALAKKESEITIKFTQEQQTREKELFEKAQKKASDAFQLNLKDKENEAKELKEQNKVLQTQLLELNVTLRRIQTDNQSMRLEFQKKLLESEEKLKRDATRKLEEEYHLKILEKDKKFADAMRLVDEYKKKLEQGSQQLQGEVLELELEGKLKSAFAYDDIIPVAKGVRGGDIVQTVRNKNGVECGKIMWELKRARTFSRDWIVKLKDDQRRMNADIAVLITNVMPVGIDRFGIYEGIWVGDYEAIIGLSTALRANLIEVSSVKSSQVNNDEKLAMLHKYIESVEFKHKVEGIVEAFTTMQTELEKEKNWFAKKWGRQEQAIRKALDQTHGMHGQLQGIMGKALPDIEEEAQAKEIISESSGELSELPF